MTRFEVTTPESGTGSTGAQVLAVESLLQDFVTTHANDNAAPEAGRYFDSRSVIAACLAFLVFAPGCAAATAFLLRNNETVPPLTVPESHPPVVMKSDRLPLDEWSSEAAESTGQKSNARLTVATIADATEFLEPMLIRGSLEDDTIRILANTNPDEPIVSAPVLTSEPIVTPRRPRARRHVRRAAPIQVAEAPRIHEPAEPTFFEKLFGVRFN